MNEKTQGKKIYVGISGGVDSSVTAALLKHDGYDVTGVFIRTWQPDWLPCTWQDERRDAMRVCAHLDIPFRELDLEEQYKRDVADYMIAEYRSGRTPNPDVMCNKHVKFGAFLNWALTKGADSIATGHYSQVESFKSHVSGDGDKGLRYKLMRGIDPKKDQSYFLWTLTQEQLGHIMFPLGGYYKDDVRKMAEKFGLFTATKKDSQGICFLGKIDMKEFLKHYIDETPGDVLNQDNEVIGHHDGALLYTLGERHGFTITSKGTHDKPYYVVAKNAQENTITVSHYLETKSKQSRKLHLHSINDIANSLMIGDNYQAHIRYHGEDKSCVLSEITNDTMTVTLDQDDATIAPGQSLVLYDGDQCMGGGIVRQRAHVET